MRQALSRWNCERKNPGFLGDCRVEWWVSIHLWAEGLGAEVKLESSLQRLRLRHGQIEEASLVD